MATAAPNTDPGSGLPTFKNWSLTIDRDDIAWLVVDRVGESVNTLGEELLGELDQVLDFLANRAKSTPGTSGFSQT